MINSISLNGSVLTWKKQRQMKPAADEPPVAGNQQLNRLAGSPGRRF